MTFNNNTDFVAAGRYRSGELIAKGAMGEVLQARVLDAPPGPDFPEIVAIKTFPPDMGFSSQAQKREIETMRQIKHPNVVELLDWGFTETCYFMVFPFFQRGSLCDCLEEKNNLTPKQGARLLLDLASGLTAIHERGVLHLDIKPANILIAEDGSYVLSDLGIASFQFLERSTRLMGTPLFMSPEQARGELDKLDARSDLFSLGATLFYALHGATINYGETDNVLNFRRFEGFPLGDWQLDQPYQYLSDMVRQLVSFQPHKRFGSAQEVVAHLENSMEFSRVKTDDRGEPVSREWRQKLTKNMGDPVLRQLLSSSGTYFKLRLFRTGTVLCCEDERSFDVYILLQGSIRITRNQEELAIENRVGSIMGEVAALVGKPRTATLFAVEDTVCAMINGAELEQAARKIPALAVRIMKTLALHLFERDKKKA